MFKENGEFYSSITPLIRLSSLTVWLESRETTPGTTAMTTALFESFSCRSLYVLRLRDQIPESPEPIISSIHSVERLRTLVLEVQHELAVSSQRRLDARLPEAL